MTISITRTSTGGATVVRMSGVVDETFNPDCVSFERGIVVFDLAEVTRVTSAGVRLWILGIERMDSEYYCFVRCRSAVVAQFNMVAGFSGKGELLTVYAPFVCTVCETLTEVLIDLRRQDQQVLAVETLSVRCSECGGGTTFDDIAELYFRFALSRRRPNPPAFVNAIIDEAASSLGGS